MLFFFEQFAAREAGEGDKEAIWMWRNSESVRAWMTNTAEINYDEHVRWFGSRRETRTGIYVVEWQSQPIGVFTFRPDPEDMSNFLMTMYLIEQYQRTGLGIVLEWFMLQTAFDQPECSCVSGILQRGNQVLSLHRFFEFDTKEIDDKYLGVSMPRAKYEKIAENLKRQIFRRLS